ncbi:MAG: imidazolonepropionase [Gammaproteobacteria bacterium RIFCSPHIGHO2_12_FULL_35_23]|nr:MAG: imidazolonepropionase [Gammaproteobacteria bacterium RIFCSPHIGHO2_12_FULL_35_23]
MSAYHWDKVFINANLATFADEYYGFIEQGALAVRASQIVWIGRMLELPTQALAFAKEIIDVKGQCITPGLIDCHTHVVYAGNRANEFEMRLTGLSYAEIAQRGGGIRSTVALTRKVSKDELFAESLPRVKAMMQQGVTTLEIKSGYGLDLENEIKMLQVAKQLAECLPLTVCPTFLGAHALPVEYQNQAEAYIDLITETILPTVVKNKLATAVDAFCENIGFTPNQVERVFQAAERHGLAIKLHAEQLSDLKGAVLAAKHKALSVDHLEYIKQDGIQAMAEAGCVAVLLPGAYYFLQEKQMPPIERLRQYQVPMAIATDCNPGSSPTTSLLLMLNMGCTLWQLTPTEVLRGVTLNAAKALGLEATHGSLQVGKIADLVIWNVKHPVELTYQFGFNPYQASYKAGELINIKALST